MTMKSPANAMISRRHLAVKDRLVTQSGFALPTAIIVLLVVTMLSAAAVAVSVRSSTSTTRDDNVKAALEAAETGLRVATYRLAMIALKAEQCVGAATSGAPEAPAGGYCQDTTETLGNAASFTYWTTPVLAEPATCAGDPVKTEPGLDQRCVTGEGKVNGVTRRVQGRVAAPSAKPLFPIHGVVGLTKLSLSGGASVKGLAGSNGKLETSGGGLKLEGGYTLGFPGGTFKGNLAEVTCPPCGMRSKEEGPIPGALPATHITAATSEDSRITKKEDELTGAVTWSAANYELALGDKTAHVVLGGSKYYFCKLTASGGGVLTVTASTYTEIFIDSFEDPGSTCKNYGKEAKVFELSGGSKLENSSNDPSKLVIEMYGKEQIVVSGAGEVAASVLAPEAKVTLSGGSALKGALLANEITISGGSFAWDERAATLRIENSGAEAYTRVPAWEECKPTGATPSAGC